MGWIPSEEEYNPEITKEQWIEFIQDKNIFNENALITFACIQKAKITTYADMAEEFGRSANFYDTNNWRTGERIFKKINCPLSEREEGGNRFWSVCCLGRSSVQGRWEFKIRPELQEAFEETGMLEGIEVMEKKEKISCIMANIAWNENDWKSPSDNKTNFRWTQVEGNIPHESWNFDFDNPRNSEEKIFGFIQFTHPPKNAERDKFLIIFRSDNKIVGFYGNAEIKKEAVKKSEYEYSNIVGDKELVVLLDNKIDDADYKFLFGKERVGMIGFNYLNPIDAQTILDEAIKINPNQIDILEKIKEWLNQGDTRMEGQYWLIAPGENARKWDEYSKNGEIGIGWEELGNIEKYGSDYESFQNDYIKTYKSENDNYRGSSPKQIWDFYKNISIGDIIFARNGVLQIVGMGKVKSDYIYDDSRDEYKQIRKVEWEKIGEWKYPGQSSRDTVHRLKPEQAKEIIKIMSMKDEPLVKKYASLLKNTKNLILTGAPGTGKTYLAKQIAKELGCKDDNIGFVQFHPSYDYTDFVEGLRPTDKDGNGNVGFERKDGVFKKFCARALKESYRENNENVDNFEECWERLVEELNENNYIDISLLSGKGNLRVELNEYGTGLANRTYENDDYQEGNWISGKSKFFSKDQLYNIYQGLPGVPAGGHDNYRKAIVEYMKKNLGLLDYKKTESTQKTKKNFVFIIDEINRGEVAKIFGELFYCVDPGYRGKDGKINTQYQNLIKENNIFYSGFFIPENVYIIGTMNDIDRSVESMDFAFRRRFTWAEVKASATVDMLYPSTNENGEPIGLESKELADEAKRRMENLNAAIWNEKEKKGIEGLNDAYHIGASYFLKLKNYDGNQDERFKSLWEYHIKGILQEYLRGNPNAQEELEKLKAAYDREEEKKDGE